MDSMADDLLDGASAIAEFLFGNKNQRRRVYHLNASRKLPLTRIGDKLVGRKSTLIQFLADGERAALATKPEK
jgi:hypothetical protein